MSIREREASCSAVIGGWQIAPLSKRPYIAIIQEIAIVEAVGVFVQKHKKIRRIRSRVQFQKLTVGREEIIRIAGPSGVKRAKIRIHGH